LLWYVSPVDAAVVAGHDPVVLLKLPRRESGIDAELKKLEQS
jgi:hypothetical protein